MSESKELLEATIKGLREKVSQLNTELTTKQKELEDINKPEMTNEMYDTLEDCILLIENLRFLKGWFKSIIMKFQKWFLTIFLM